ncbi:MAG: DNA alkylation repair protein [Sphingobacteriales bacterium]|nr:MAG: DNA alkylation repair protein [Sphingobacteriales bacterium]
MPYSLESILTEIRTLFESAAIPEQAAPMEAYMKGIAPFLGIRAPDRKAIERELFKQYQSLPFESLPPVLLALMAQPEREFHYLAIDWLYVRRKDFTLQTIQLIEALLTTKSWWDTVDVLAPKCLGYWAARFPEAARPVLNRYTHNTNFWLARATIIHQLDAKEQTNTSLLTAAIEPQLSNPEFFIRKAIGWALRQYARTNPQWVIHFVADHPQLSNLSRKEALRRIPL